MNRRGFLFRILAVCFFALSLLSFILSWLTYALSDFTMLSYDSAFRMLWHVYFAGGLTPYKDFGILYPPGMVMLIGYLIQFKSISQSYLILSILVLIGVFSVVLIFFVFSRKKSLVFLACGFYLFLETKLLDQIIYGDPFARILLILLVQLSLLYFLSGRKIFLGASFLLAFSTVWFRWNHILVFLFLQFAIVAVISIIEWAKKRKTGLVRVLLRSFQVNALGCLVGILAIGIYLWSIGAIYEGFDFIFRVQLTSSRYWGLSLPAFNTERHEAAVMLSFLIPVYLVWFSTSTYALIKNRTKQAVAGWYIAILPLFTTQYMFSRLDMAHIGYAYFFVGFALICQLLISEKKTLTLLFIVVLLLPSFSLFTLTTTSFSGKGRAEEGLIESISDCKQLAEGMSRGQQKSLFVGRLSYESFVLGNSALYFINTDIPPATAFIVDEPGIQNSNHYGMLITSQLERAPKPMLAYLEVADHYAESEAIAKMGTSRKIEGYLAKHRYKTIGTCRAYDTPYVARLYY